MSQILSIAEYYGHQKVNKCGYCKTNKGHSDHGLWLHYLTVYDYQNLIDRGWRRSGSYGYKNIMKDACCPMYTIRCSSNDLKLSKSQKKIIKKFNRFITDGHRRKWHNKGKNSDRENMEIPSEFHQPIASVKCVTESDFAKNGTISDSTFVKEDNASQITTSEQQSGDGAASKRNQNKRKTLRIERAIQRVMTKGKTEEEALQILKAKKKYPKIKTLEEFLNECVKPNQAHHLEIKFVLSNPSNEQFEQTFETEYELYRKYQVTVHKDNPDKCTTQQFRRFLVNSPLEPQLLGTDNAPVKCFGSYHQQYWLDGKLIAVGVIDILPYCVSSVYFFYDPDYNDLVLGTYGSMRELQLARELQTFVPSLRYYYMGFYIHSCPKMRYKARISPSYLLCPEVYTWHSISDCIDKLEKYGYCRLNEDPLAKDENEATSVDEVMVLFRENILRYAEFRRKCKTEDVDEIKEYVKSIGKKCASSIILYRG